MTIKNNITTIHNERRDQALLLTKASGVNLKLIGLSLAPPFPSLFRLSPLHLPHPPPTLMQFAKLLLVRPLGLLCHYHPKFPSDSCPTALQPSPIRNIPDPSDPDIVAL